MYFESQYWPYVKQLRSDLAERAIKDVQLDELIDRNKWLFEIRQQHVDSALANPQMYFLSIEDMRKMGERFKFLATQVPE